MTRGSMKLWGMVLSMILLSACGDSDPGSTTSATMTITVHSGESIQAAVDAAPANATILVEPGVYHESSGAVNAVVISKDGIQLVGRPTPDHPVVLENAGGQMNGIVVAPHDSVDISTDEHPGEHPPCGANGNMLRSFSLQGFTVVGFDQFGVYLACVDGFTLTQNATDADQLYGLFPVRSHHGTMSHNETTNTSMDAAIYVGQSDHVTITGNTTHDNLLGLEVENSSDVTVTGNQVFNNTIGIVADINNGLQKKDQTNVLITDNDVHDNNRENTGSAEDTGAAPPGTGIVILGGFMGTVQNNRVGGNGFVGIIVASYCASPSSCGDLDIDPDPRDNHIVNNQLTNNGMMPPADPIEAALAADLIWDKSGTGNCWSGNTPTATVKILGGGKLPACQ